MSDRYVVNTIKSVRDVFCIFRFAGKVLTGIVIHSRKAVILFFQQKIRNRGSVFQLFDVSDNLIQYYLISVIQQKTLKISILYVWLLIAELCTSVIFN